jgi:uncharacterized protein (DUF1778 family)
MEKTTNIILRVTPGQKAAWEGAAKLAGVSLSEWIRSSLVAAVTQTLKNVHKAIEKAKNPARKANKASAHVCERHARMGFPACSCPKPSK